MNRDDIIRMALEVLEQINQLSIGENAIALPGEIDAAMDSLRAAIEQAEKRQWVELTDDEARALVNRATFGDRTNWQALVYMVDAKLKEKNA
jgi:nitrogen fixation/metabolism regulation signal transduction histidine kinase